MYISTFAVFDSSSKVIPACSHNVGKRSILRLTKSVKSAHTCEISIIFSTLTSLTVVPFGCIFSYLVWHFVFRTHARCLYSLRGLRLHGKLSVNISRVPLSVWSDCPIRKLVSLSLVLSFFYLLSESPNAALTVRNFCKFSHASGGSSFIVSFFIL